MLGYKRKRLELINMMCRACGKEDPDAVAIFSETGKRQNILKKIQACLPIHIHENDNYPNKICLSCLTKLDASWDWYISCKTAQIDIEQKLYELRNQKSNQANSDSILEGSIVCKKETEDDPPVGGSPKSAPLPSAQNDLNLLKSGPNVEADPNACGICKITVTNDDMGIACDGHCNKWYHIACIKMPCLSYIHLMENQNESWVCGECKKKDTRNKEFHKMGVEEKLRNLSESYPVSYGESAVICLAREPSPTPTPPPPAVNRETVDPVMTTVTYLTSASTSAAVPPTSSRAAPEEIFPQALIQVPQNTASEPIMYQMSTPAPALAPATPAMPTVIKRRPPTLVPKPKTSPVPVSATTTSQPSNSAPAKRKNSETLNGPNAKKECVYCKKLFTDDIIDHHVSLHLRQSFSSCVECGKNFRSEEAMQRHRCGDKKNHETINLDDDDDDELIIV